MSLHAPEQGDLPAPNDLTRFQWEVLSTLVGGEQIGLELKAELEDEYDAQEVNHSRLYTNLDDLREAGLITKRERDQRSNYYGLTDKGLAALEEYRVWLGRHFNGGDGA